MSSDSAAQGALESEFDVVAAWTEQAVNALGPDYAVPAGCRGSGSPSSLAWLAESMEVDVGTRMLDVGSGVGGPAAWLLERFGARSTCLEPMAAAAGAGARLFRLPSVVGDATALPFADGSFDALWCLGVLCTVPDKQAALDEARRVLRADGQLGLLVFVLDGEPTLPLPDGNDFPSGASLRALLDGAGFAVLQEVEASSLPASPLAWQARADRVDAWMREHHGSDPRWVEAQEQADRIGALLSAGEVRAVLLHAVAVDGA